MALKDCGARREDVNNVKEGSGMIETIKDIAAVVGCFSTVLALGTTLIKPIRVGFVNFIKSKAQTEEQQTQLDGLREQIEALAEKVSCYTSQEIMFRDEILESVKVLNNGMAMSLGNIIRNIYNHYKADEKIPEKEYEVMEAIYGVYSEGLHKNGVIKRMHEEIADKWEII